MDQKSHGRTTPRVCRLLAGLQAGVWAGVAMLAWFAAASAVSNHSIWIIPNMTSSLLERRSTFRTGFGLDTLPGIALHLVASGLVGMIFGLLVREARNRLRVRLLGLVMGLIWYYLSNDLFWKRVGPAMPRYASPAMMLTGYLVFGIALGWYSASIKMVRYHLLDEGAPPPVDSPAAPLEP